MALTIASASTSSSSSSSASSHIYDVFLNHRGCDIKKTFASHLYRRLRSSCLRVFLDQPELQQGESLMPQIVGAIESASVHVAIFSPQYAGSRWCLDELVLMLLISKKKPGAIIIPVFYNVEPSVLRWTNKDNVYTKALLRHEESGRYKPETIAGWKEALKEVSNISGFELKAYNGDEGELVDRVVERVLKTVRKPALPVARYPTGLDKKLEDLEKVLLQQQHTGQAKFVLIVGLGGVGKTTITKEFFNRKKSDYYRSSFLPDVRDAAARRCLTSLQGKLYEDLTGNAMIMHSDEEGTGMLRGPLSCSEALIIFDDVDHVDQLLAFFSPGQVVLPSGSLIIVTSRNQKVLASLGIGETSKYKMTGLDEEDSQVLFCSHAFDQPGPDAGFEEVVKKFLEVCDGLPLSLKVFGAQLHGEELEHWHALLRKISKPELPKDILSTLKISYDSLEEEEKKIFVDSACFFIGIERDTAIRVWDGSGWEGSLGLRNLQYRCLVEIDSRNCIRMHDHLRDLGRDLADKDPLGCGRRLWCTTDNRFRNVPPQSSVRGISLVQQRDGEAFQIPSDFSNHIADICGLQLLIAPGDCLESLFKLKSHPDLLWLRCLCFQINNSDSSLSSWIPIRNLRVLEVQSGRYWQQIPTLGTLWNAQSEAPLQLRELKIGVDLSRLPKSIGQLKYLERIELHNFKGTLPEGFFQLRSLKHLKLKAGMKSLPDTLVNFTSLQHIDLSGCELLQTLPNSLGKLTKLQRIYLSDCWELQTLPPSFGNLTKLQHLNLSDCRDLILSAETLGNISTLERLIFSRCYKIEALPRQVTCQQYLQELILDFTKLKELPSGIGDLSHLEILSLYGTCLERLPDSVGKLTNLRELRLSSWQLNYFPDSVGQLKQLTSLSICHSPIGEVPFASVEKVVGSFRLMDSSTDNCMPTLKSLDLSRTGITEISFGEGVCPVLQWLGLGDCFHLGEVGALPTTLTSVNLTNCGALKKITGLRGLAKLRELDMVGCKEIEELPGLGVRELNNIERLDLGGCPISVVSFAFGSVVNLEGGLGLLDLSTERCMLRLKHLTLSETRITKISFGEGACPVLQSLDLSQCVDLEEVGPLPSTLGVLTLGGCCALKKITVCGLANLYYLDMGGPIKIEELVGLDYRELINLRSLYMRWSGITEISFGEGVCPVLERLTLSSCDALVEVGALPTTLTSLDLNHCGALKKITGLRGLAKLRWLEMSWCYAVEEMPGLETLVSLQMFATMKCDKMRRIQEMAEAENPESDVLKRVLRIMERDIWVPSKYSAEEVGEGMTRKMYEEQQEASWKRRKV